MENKIKEKICQECGDRYTKTGKYFCSHSCSTKNRCKNNPNYIKKISEANKGSKNGMWKGDSVGYASLHEWIKNNKPKPEFCEVCGKNKPYDLANISGEYKRDINDFEWLCRSCHMKKDFKNGTRKKLGRDKKEYEKEAKEFLR